jgi:hypothetical protein
VLNSKKNGKKMLRSLLRRIPLLLLNQVTNQLLATNLLLLVRNKRLMLLRLLNRNMKSRKSIRRLLPLSMLRLKLMPFLLPSESNSRILRTNSSKKIKTSLTTRDTRMN